MRPAEFCVCTQACVFLSIRQELSHPRRQPRPGAYEGQRRLHSTPTALFRPPTCCLAIANALSGVNSVASP